MPNDKVKMYKNSARNQQSAVRHYIPQYQLLGIEPQEHKNGPFPGQVLMTRGGVISGDNPRTRQPTIRQPYAEVVPSQIGNGPVPNVGNNMEHTWAGVDDSLIDDLSNQTIDPNHQMIDNNDIVIPADEQPMEVQDDEPIQMLEQPSKPFWTAEDLQNAISKSFEEDPSSISSLQDNSYILLIRGEIISIGMLHEIEEEANALIFGEHDLCEGKPIPLDDIVVFKKIKIKTGLFLE